MMNKQLENRATIEKWYNDMWGKADSSRIGECIADEYLRHDLTGANNRVTAESYAAMVDASLASCPVRHFTYFAVVEGDFIGTMGRFLIQESTQWDWVQLFRAEQARLAETWLPGMGGTLVEAFPRPDIAWTDSTVPKQALAPMTPEKAVVREWYESLAHNRDATSCLAPKIRAHDLKSTDTELTAVAMQERWRDLMQQDQVTELELFLIQEGDFVFATGKWLLGEDSREWNWVQAFRLQNGQIAEYWITSIGGTDTSIKHMLMTWGENVLPGNSNQPVGTQTEQG